MPLPARVLLIALVLCFAGAMLFVGTGMATRVIGELGRGVAGVVGRIGATAAPTSLSSGDVNSPRLDAPENGGYTNQKGVTITGSVPGEAANKPNYTVRIFEVTAEGERKQVAELPVGAIVRFSAPNVPLVEGLNTFVATLASSGVNGPESAPVTFTLDTVAPPLTVTAPTNNSTIVGSQVTVAGKTEPGANVVVLNNQSSGGGEPATAGPDGLFQVKVALGTGPNSLTVTATDKAGNQKAAGLTVRRSLGRLAATLTASPNRINVSNPTQLVLSVRATGSDGTPLADAEVVFTIQIKGLGPIVSNTTTPIRTDPLGRATFPTVITGGEPGTGTASVVVTTARDGTVRAQTPITTFK